MVIYASGLEGYSMHSTPNEFFRQTMTFMSHNMQKFKPHILDENRLKLAMARSPCMKYLKTHGIIDVRDTYCQLPESVIQGELAKGRQMKVLKTSNLKYERFTTDHYNAVMTLKNALVAHCIAHAHAKAKKIVVATPQDVPLPGLPESALKVPVVTPRFPLHGSLHIPNMHQTRSQSQLKPTQVPNRASAVFTSTTGAPKASPHVSSTL
jgi:hypothetical protein